MKTKLTSMEKRAASFCAKIQADGEGTLNVEWRKSREWSYCPAALDYRGEKMAYASGCGYDKLSTVLCDALAPLVPDGALHSCHGAGVRSVIDRMALYDWTVVQTANGSTFDAFIIKRADPASVKAA